MPTTRRRRPVDEDRPVSRRRDRAAEEPDEEEEEEEEVEATHRPRKSTTAKTRRRPAPEPEDEDEDEDEDEEEEEAPRTRKKTTTRRRPAPEPEDDDDEDGEEEEEEEEPPRRKKTTARRRPARDEDEEEEEKPARRRSTRTTKSSTSKLPPGVYTGADGAETVRKSGGSGVDRLKLTNSPELFKCLDIAPTAFKQHWVPQGGGAGDRAHVCPAPALKCPLCANGDRFSKSFVFNILHFPADGPPVNKVLQMGVKAYDAFVAEATPRNEEKPKFTFGYFSVVRSGKGDSSQTSFKKVKVRDLEEDWPEIFETFEPDELKEVVEEGKANKFKPEQVVRGTPIKELQQIAKHLSTDEDEEE